MHLIPLCLDVIADLETPVTAYLKVARGPYSFLLESVEGGERLARYSFIGTEPRAVCASPTGRASGWTRAAGAPCSIAATRLPSAAGRGSGRRGLCRSGAAAAGRRRDWLPGLRDGAAVGAARAADARARRGDARWRDDADRYSAGLRPLTPTVSRSSRMCVPPSTRRRRSLRCCRGAAAHGWRQRLRGPLPAEAVAPRACTPSPVTSNVTREQHESRRRAASVN